MRGSVLLDSSSCYQVHDPLALLVGCPPGGGPPPVPVRQALGALVAKDRPQPAELPDTEAHRLGSLRVGDPALLGRPDQAGSGCFLLAHREVSHGEDTFTLQLGRTESCRSHTR